MAVINKIMQGYLIIALWLLQGTEPAGRRVAEPRSPQGVIQLIGTAGIRDASGLEPLVRSAHGIVVIARQELASVDIYDGSSFRSRLPNFRYSGIGFIRRAPLALLSDSELVIFDRRARKLVFYRLGEDGVPELSKEIGADRNYGDFCSARRRLYMYAATTVGNLDVLDFATGRIRSNWISVYQHRPPVETDLNNARLVCDPADRSVYVANVLQPTIIAFSHTGNRLWTASIKGHVTVPVKIDGGHSFGLIPTARGYHSLISFQRSQDALWVQYRLITNQWPAWGHLGRILTVAISATDGKELFRSESLPMLLNIVDSTYYKYDPEAGIINMATLPRLIAHK